MSDAALVPHVLQLVDHGLPAPEYLSLSPIGWAPLEQATVFPSFRLAQRYADHFIRTTHRIWMPVATPSRDARWLAGGARCRACGCSDLFACPSHCAWIEPDLCSVCAKPDPPELWAVYQSPKDFPGQAVARRFVGQVPTTTTLVADTLDALRAQRPAHLTTAPRAAGDDPVIVETWL